MLKITTLIVDDEDLARIRIRRLLEQESDIEIVGECCNGEEAIASIRRHSPNLVFLDIQMQRVSGFDVLEAVEGETDAMFIFTTAYDQYAVKAFEAHALDYLLKPFSEERFQEALKRCREWLRSREVTTYSNRLLALLQDTRPGEMVPPPVITEHEYAGRIVIKSGSKLLFIDPADIDWIEAEGVYVRLFTGQKTHLLRESLGNVEERLDPKHFVRIHRSTLVNVSRIREIIPHLNGGSVVVLQDGRKLKMSRSYRDRVHATLG